MGYQPTLSNDPVTLKSGALTTSYVASSALRMKGWNAITLQFAVDLDASATGLQFYVEVANQAGDAAPAAGDWHALATTDEVSTTGTGLSTWPAGIKIWDFGALDPAKYAVTLERVAAKWLRVQIKTAGTAGSTTCTVTAIQALV